MGRGTVSAQCLKLVRVQILEGLALLLVFLCLFPQLGSEMLLAQPGTKAINLGKLKWSGKPEIKNTAHGAEVTVQQPHFFSICTPPSQM